MDHDDAALAWDLLQRFADPASQRFDGVLAAAGVNDETARALRFWHRESVQAVKQYAAHVLPAVFATLAEGAAESAASTDRAESAWRAAGQELPASVPGRALPDPGPEILRTPHTLEERRRTVAARLAQIG